jgi:uncharacterized MAPEG superfamily protein
MPIEVRYLVWSVVLGIGHVLLTGMLTTAQHGIAYGLSPRDEKKELTGVAARVERAFSNFMQTFPFFSAAIAVAHALDRHNWMTVWGAGLYFWARLAFVPLYAMGIPGPRTLAFAASIAGIVFVLVGSA